ncbi:MAG: hypothetical protein O2944_08050 [Proteobacteria bacterium]|nr:hypothetical protein [Pseudomonadota bacterium]
MAKTGYVSYPGLITLERARSQSKLIGQILAKQGGADGPTSPGEANVSASPDPRFDAALRELIPELITDDIVTEIESALGAHFRIDFASFYRSHSIAEPQGSFLWHRDLAPMSQVHLLVYLTDGPERGGTSYLNRTDTRRAAQNGYHFLPIGKRAGDLGPIFANRGDPPTVFTPVISAGDAILFSAPRVLHRGVLPTGAPRDALLLIFQASPVPWRIEFEDVGVGHLVLPSSKNTLHTNPFLPMHPNIATETDGVYDLPPPWVLEGRLTESDQ